MNLLQRYVMREMIGPVLLSILFFSFLLLLRQLFRFAEMLLEAGVGIDSLIQIVAIISVTLVIVTIPMAALLGSMIGVGRLTSENEILAMRVSGISLHRIFLPVFVTAALGSTVLMWAGFNFLPSMMRHLAGMQDELAFQVLTNLEAGRNYDNLSPRGSTISLFFEERANPQPGDGPFTLRMKKVALRVEGRTQGLTGANVPTSKDQKRETLFFANEGIIRGDPSTQSVNIELLDGTVLPLNRTEPTREMRLHFDRMVKDISPGGDDRAVRLDRVDPRQLSLHELRARTAELPNSSFWKDDKKTRIDDPWQAHLNARNELYQRYTLPWSLLAFVLIAVPLAVELRPRAKTISFIISIALIVLYYVMNTWAGAVGMMEGSSATLTFAFYMLPNVLIGSIGIFLFWRSQH